MPRLRDLVLQDTVPFFDTKRLHQTNIAPLATTNEPGEIPGDATRISHPIELPELRSIEWSYPYPVNVHRLLSCLFVPSLERLHLFLNDLSSMRTDMALLRAYSAEDELKGHYSSIEEQVIRLNSLQELCLQCVDDDALTHALRDLAFPLLEKLAIDHVDLNQQKGYPPVVVFPRLESVLRDPRLPHLTHLSLSGFQLDAEHGRSMLGYMPALTSLSLDACSGVRVLLEALAETSLGRLHATPVDRVASQRLPVKFCPRLESISLFVCDAEAEGLRRVVKTRNVEADLNRHSVDAEIGSSIPIWLNGKVTPIRPMKKLRRPPGGLSSSSGTKLSASVGMISTVIPLEAALHPARIDCVYIEDCGSITEEEAFSLRDLGVDDVQWTKYLE